MSIRVEGKDEYKWNYGHTPRGQGFWSFKMGVNGETKTFRGNYAHAQKRALAYAHKHHPNIYYIKVLL